ncbi:MAG: type VI secretion protein IcmF/TssM N-terminal domain-containing protein, partial [Gammaproteobacteria bacterium]
MNELIAFFQRLDLGSYLPSRLRVEAFINEWDWLFVVLFALGLILVVWWQRQRLRWIQSGGRRLGGWSFDLLKALRYLTTRREWRYATPWTLLVGDPGSGKTSVVRSIKSGRRSKVLLREARLAVADSEWAFFDGGVAIDIRDEPGDDPDKALNHWRAVLEDIDAQRPERPLDSVVLTLSAHALLKPPPGGLQQLAERQYQRLFELQKRLSFSLPVYLLITHCESIEGFSAFWDSQPEPRQRELFGWSNPYNLEQSFGADWVDAAFSSLNDSLFEAQLNAAANTDIEDPDNFFLFPRRLMALRKPLRTVLSLIFKPSGYHEAHALRGIYLTGRPVSEAGDPEKPSDDLLCVDELLSERAFRERSLAHPTREGMWSRNRLIRHAQMALVGAGALSLALLAISAIHLSTDVDATLSSLNSIDQNDDDGAMAKASCDPGNVDDIYQQLDTLTHISADWRFLMIPASWLDSGIPTATASAVADLVFKKNVLPSLRCRLEQRATALAERTPDPIPRDLPPEELINTTRQQALAYL